jgi:hypothetical protein
MNIKEMVKDNKQVTFEFYRKSELWYKTECGFMFPVPIKDCGDGTFLPKDKAMMFMRYIRKQIQAVDKAFETEHSQKTVTEILDENGLETTGVTEILDFGTRIARVKGEGLNRG